MCILVGCGQDPQAPEPTANSSRPTLRDNAFTIHNDATYLESRLQRLDRMLPLCRGDATRGGSAQIASTSVRLTLVGQITPPVVEGRLVQADDIDIDDLSRIAVVGYNFAGDPFAGALDVIDFRQADHPVLLSEVLFRDADVNSVCKRGTYIFAGLASSDPALSTPALLRQFQLGLSGVYSTGVWRNLPSWSVTDLAGSGEQLAAAVGARSGGLAMLDRTTLQLQSFAVDADARACAFDGATSVMTLCGAPARLVRRAVSGLQMQSSAEATGFSYEGAKGTLEVQGAYSYLAAGDGGFQVRDRDGNLLDSLANREFSTLRPGLAVTNAVSADAGLAFVAAGAVGVQVVDLGRWQATPPAGSATQGLRLLGEIGFDDGVSCNMVKVRSNILLVAGGLGGVKLVRMDPIN